MNNGGKVKRDSQDGKGRKNNRNEVMEIQAQRKGKMDTGKIMLKKKIRETKIRGG